MKQAYLGSLLHISDPTLPIGGYTHSNGLETYVQNGQVSSAKDAKIFVHNMLANNLKYNDGAFLCMAYQAAQGGDFETILALDEELTALKLPREILYASQKLGLRLIKIFKRNQEFELASKYEKAIINKETNGHYSITFGLYAQLLDIPLEEALYSFYYNAAVGIITNSVKLVPLGQLDGQDILFGCHQLIASLIKPTIELDRSLVGICNIGFDIRCMQHEKLYSRLYMS